MTTKKKFSKETITKIPKNKPQVYKLHNSKDDLLYVGTAKKDRISERLLEHKKEPKFKSISKFTTTNYKSKEQAKKAETRIIKKEKPKLNKIGKK